MARKKTKTKTYYHATEYENLYKCMRDGIKAGPDGLVYMCEKEEECVRFLFIRGVSHVVTFRIEVEEPDKVIETFDHNFDFFQCRCFGFLGDIPASWIEPSSTYDFS